MSKQENRAKAKDETASNVVPLPQKCAHEGCKKTTQKSSFCNEHYEWFKFGLITRTGEKPRDFDKKYQDFMRKKSAA